MKRRVVISGIGMVTSIGTGREEFWKNLLLGRSGIGPVESFDTSHYSVHKGAEVRQFEPENYVLNLDVTQLGRASQLAIAAARLALVDADVQIGSVDRRRVGVSMGTTSGEPREVERFDDYYSADTLDQFGPEFIRRYPCKAEAMLAGGADSFSRITYAGFARLGAVAPETCQPFDRNRKGMIPGEGAAVLVLETLEQARKRSARIYAEAAGYGLSCDANHMTAGDRQGDGAARAMAEALKDSDTKPDEVSYISAHGTGTPTNDLLETIAVKRVFRESAYGIPISSIKSMLGHAMGAASAIEAGTCALSVFHDLVPPTINLLEPDPDCDLDYVPNHAREHRVEVAMNNAYAFGGNNASLILKKCAASA